MSTLLRLLHIFSLLALPAWTALLAQETPRVIRFSNEKILNDQIWSIAQAADDRMYFGTSNGVLTFDGSNWEVLQQTQSTIVRSVASEGSGKLFAGSYCEFGSWQRKAAGSFEYSSLSDLVKERMEGKEEIWHILTVGEKVFFQSFSTIYKFENGTVTTLKPPGNIMFLQAVSGKVLFQKIDGGIYELSASNSFQSVPGTNLFSDKKVVFILPSPAGGLLVGTEQHGIFLWENGLAKPWDTPLQSIFKSNQLNKGIQLSNGDFAFGTIVNGLFILNGNGRLKFHINKKKGLPDNTVLSLLEDRRGNLWLGLDRGIALVDLKNPLLFFTDEGGSLGTVYTAAEFEGNLYLGTNHGVFYRKISEVNSQFQFVNETQGQVWELRVFGQQLLCGHNDGTFSISGNNAKKISSVNGGWTTLQLPDDPNKLLQGTYSGLVVFKRGENGQWVFSHRVSDFLEPVQQMVIDDAGEIWLAHPIEGLHRVRLDSTKTNFSYIRRLTTGDGLPSEKMLRVALSNGKAFVKAGQSWHCYEDGRFTNTGHFNGVPLTQLSGWLKQGASGSWFEISPNEITLRSDVPKSKPSSLAGHFEDIVSLDSNRYLLCMNDGYAILDLKKLQDFEQKSLPVVQITSLEILGDESPEPVSLNEEKIELESRENRLRFQVFQPIFTRSPVFRYRLKGLENSWSDWTEKPEIEYFNLPAGEYVFQVESRFGGQRAALEIEILPHWSESSIAKVFYFLVFAGLFWLTQIFYRKRLEKAKQKLVAEQERLLAEQRMQADNEKLQLDVENKSKELANSTFNLARKNEILLQLKKELKELKSAPGSRLPGKQYQHLLHLIDVNLTSEQDWELFEKNFNQVHEAFFKKLKSDFPNLTPGDLQLAAYLKMNLPSKEIAPLLRISLRGIENKRYRLRKKLGLPPDGNLTEFMMKY